MNILLRKTTFTDIPFLWYLRNLKETYQYFQTPTPVEWEVHVNWIMPIILGTAQKELYIIEHETLPSGQLRFDCSDTDSAMVSISLLPYTLGKGIGGCALTMGMQKVHAEKKITHFSAEVHESNSPSIKLFERAHFNHVSTADHFLRYELVI